ncbi:hypothetical protein C8F01DRAFT_1179675 [Mycena amicta]|nr:hypothetical protein C8F01DRAFT_1179675 [Mycena amicta]
MAPRKSDNATSNPSKRTRPGAVNLDSHNSQFDTSDDGSAAPIPAKKRSGPTPRSLRIGSRTTTNRRFSTMIPRARRPQPTKAEKKTLNYPREIESESETENEKPRVHPPPKTYRVERVVRDLKSTCRGPCHRETHDIDVGELRFQYRSEPWVPGMANAECSVHVGCAETDFIEPMVKQLRRPRYLPGFEGLEPVDQLLVDRIFKQKRVPKEDITPTFIRTQAGRERITVQIYKRVSRTHARGQAGNGQVRQAQLNAVATSARLRAEARVRSERL